jgi:hypothetical protein
VTTKRVAVVFDEQEMLEIEMIVRDQDQEAALALVREIKHRIDTSQRNICGQGVVTGSQPA